MAENTVASAVPPTISTDTNQPSATDGSRSSGSPKPINEEKHDAIINTGDKPEKDETADAEPNEGFSNYFRLWRYATPLDTVLRLCGFFAAIAGGTALPLMTIVFGQLVNDFNGWGVGTTTPEQLRSAVNRNALFFVYLFLGKFVLVYVHTTCFTITATRSVRRLRLEYVRAFLRQDMAYFDTYTPGSVATRISNNANLIQAGLGEKVGVATLGFSMLISAFVVAFTRYWKLAIVVATTVPTVVIIVGITVVLDANLEAKILRIYSKAGGLVEEAFGSIRVVTAFGAQKKLLRKYESYLEAAKAYGVKKGPILGVQYSTEFFVIHCAYALAFWYGVKLYLRGELADGGTVLTVLFSVVLGTSALTIIAPSIGEFSKAAAAATDVLKMIDREPQIDSTSTEGLQRDDIEGNLELKGITFAYPARPTLDVLDDVSIKFEARKTTALVGASGCGKSTIVGLLERWYDPGSGDVRLDGDNIKTLNLRWLRRQIGLVQQEPVLFSDTIYNNVAYGLEGSAMAEYDEEKKRDVVREACVEANADGFIRDFPQGYDTKVGERGGLLSGGQKQRIAIARSIISNPKILLLDEATSALDPKAEGIVQAALDNVSRTRTTIMIAHRLSTVKKADKIVVMSKGRVIEEGTHDSLLAAEGSYARLVTAQNLAPTTVITSTEDEEPENSLEAVVSGLNRATTTRSAKSTGMVSFKTDDVSRKLSLFRCLLIVFHEQRQHWPYFVCGGIAAVGAGAVFPLQAFLFSKIVTLFQLDDAALRDRADFWSLMFFILALGTLLSYASIGIFLTIAAFICSRFYRGEYFAAMLRQDIEYFDQQQNSSGGLTARLSTDPQALQDLVSANIGLILIVLVNLISSCALALALGWKLALVAIFGALPALFLAGFIRMRLEMTNQDRTAKLYVESARFASEAVGAMKTVSSLTLEPKVYDNYAERLRGPVSKSYRHTLVTMIFFGLSDSIDLAAMGLTFWYGGRLLSFGEYSPETFFIIFVAIIFGGQAAGFLFGYTLNTTKAHASANQILHLRSEVPPINSSTGAELMINDSDVAIEFKNVTFAYSSRPNHPVLRNLNMKIYKGQNVGLVGPSGCGKTTVIALLERFYDVTSGEILISGQALPSLDIQAYRAHTGLVSQETMLYQGSIRENILLGMNEDVPEERLVKACRDANIHDFITSLPEGYETESGSRGLALSGGQRQRLAVARALLRDPRLLLLDEATSALDTESERVVQTALETAAKGRTTIAVAHRLSTVREADQLFVLDAGRVAEHGTHAELIARRGRYWEMCQAQSLDREAA
ncbi:MAG: multidrug-resistance transporter mdr5 [Piccolia ochrophora]|nr:MAG: multidrug-resistance transporter mdr5 [Piccolia ochrophora]